MEEQLVQALIHSMDPVNDIRKSATDWLESMISSPGFSVLLIQVSHNSGLALEIRQLASILLKNQVEKWKKLEIPASDQQFLKSNLINCLKLSVPEKIRAQYLEIAQRISKKEFPWEGLNTQISEYLNSSDPDLVFAALCILAKASKNYEFVMTEKRQRLKELMTNFFPSLLNLLNKLVQENSPNVFPYINLILQTYWSCFYIELPPEFATAECLNAWISNFVWAISLEFDGHLPADHYAEEEKAKEPKLECIRWASQILYRFFNRYHNVANQIDTNKLIGEVFNHHWALSVMGIVVKQVFSYGTRFIPSATLNYFLKYLIQSLKHEPTCEALKQAQIGSSGLAIPSMLTDLITPILCKKAYDEELWQDNPIEYIRKETDLGRAYYSPETAATDLLETLCERGYLQQFLDYLSASLSKPPTPREKEALIYQVGSVSKTLLDSPALANSLQAMLATHVLPEFTSHIGFLRARACWVYSKFASFPGASADSQQIVLEKMCLLLLDPELPVKYEASLSIPKILSWEISKTRIRSEISNLLKIYLDIINEIDSEEVIEALEEIVSNFSEEVTPFAVEFIQHLCVTFKKLASREIADDNGDSAMAAVSTLNTIFRLIETVADKPEELQKICEGILPVLTHCLSKEGFEYMEEALKILATLLYNTGPGQLNGLFELCRIIFRSLAPDDPYGCEKTEEMYPVIANFVAKYPEFIVGELPTMVGFLAVLLTQDSKLQNLACKILIVLLEHLKANVVPHLTAILGNLVVLLQNSQSNKIKTVVCQVIFVMIFTTGTDFVVALHGSGSLQQVLNFTLANIKHFKEKYQKIQAILGLSSLLPLIPNVLTSIDTISAGQILSALIELIKLAEEDSDDSEEIIDPEGKDFNNECEELYKKIKERLEDSQDEKDLFDNDLTDFYDSMFETFDYRAYFKEKVRTSVPDLVTSLVNGLQFEHKAIMNRLINGP